MFYEQLQKACKMKNTTVSRLLIDLGIGKSNGSYWKKGTVPSSDVVVKIAKHLNVSTDFLLIGQSDHPDRKDLSAQTQFIVKLYESLDEKSKAKAEGFMEALADQSKS